MGFLGDWGMRIFMRLAAIAAMGFLSFSEPAKADVYYWSFSGAGACGAGPACSVGITNVSYVGIGSLTVGNADGSGFDVTSFSGNIYEGGGFGYDYQITAARLIHTAAL
jgi:hypothetical protein